MKALAGALEELRAALAEAQSAKPEEMDRVWAGHFQDLDERMSVLEKQVRQNLLTLNQAVAKLAGDYKALSDFMNQVKGLVTGRAGRKR